MTRIGIVGAGVAGLQLGLLLQKHGISATVYTDRSPDQQRASRLLNTVGRSPLTRARERELGVNHWDTVGNVRAMHLYIHGEQPLAFRGDLAEPWSFVDMRLYLATLLEDFIARGGDVVVGALRGEDVAKLGEQHELVVVASGRGSLIELFPRVPEHSPYTSPQRLLCAGLYDGIRPIAEGMNFNIAPGHGEIFQAPMYTSGGLQGALLFEAIPGGAFEVLTRLRYDDDPRRFEATVLDVLREHAPNIYARIDPAQFALTRPLDLLQGAITPTVRRGYIPLGNGRFALAIGDVGVVNDPITGQGANLASHSAWVLGHAILEDFAFDERFCQVVERRIWEQAQSVSEWTNFMLQPPAPYVIDLMVAAAQNQSIANAFANNFATPQRNWSILASPERTTAFLRTFQPSEQEALLPAL